MSGRPRSCAHSPRDSTVASCSAPASTSSPRRRSGRSWTSPGRPAACSRPTSRRGGIRARWRCRCWTSCASRRCSSSRTCIGPTRRRSTCCASSGVASPRTPSLVLVTYREDDVADDHPLRRLLGELRPWRPSSASRFLRCRSRRCASSRRRTTADGDAIYALTRGNPFFATEFLAAGGETLPATVRDAVLARIARLSPAARRLLEGVALDAHPCRAVAARRGVPGRGRPRRRVRDRRRARRASTRRRVPPRAGASRGREHGRRRGAGRTFTRRSWRALEAAPAELVDSSRLAHHAEGAGDGEAVVRHGRAAAQRGSMTGAHREAAAQYERVLRHASGAPPADRADLLAAYALEAEASGATRSRSRALNDAIDLRRSLGDKLREGDHLARLTTPFIVRGSQCGGGGDESRRRRAPRDAPGEPRACDCVRIPGVRADAQTLTPTRP